MKTATRHRRGRPRNEAIRTRRREEILDAAARLFALHGYARTNTQALADTLGVGKGTIYRYFATKRQLFLAAVDRLMRRLTEAMDQSIAGVQDPLERFARIVYTYLAYFDEHPEFAELLIQERAQFKDRRKPTYFVYRDERAKRGQEELRPLIAQGRVRNVPPDRIGEVVGNLLYGTMFTNYFVGRQRSVRQQAEDILDIVFHGILTDAERKRSLASKSVVL
ncbi:MAG: TetR/AcrR family transcriptional regulator [Thermoguttaceae bacterium]